MLRILAFLTTFLIPFYILRFEVLGIPTNVFEVAVLLLLGAVAISVLKNKKTSCRKGFSLLLEGWKSDPVVRAILISGIIFIISSVLGIVNAGFSEESLGIFKSWVMVPILLALAISYQLSAARKNDERNSLTASSYKLAAVFCGLYASVLAVSGIAVLQRLGVVGSLLYQVGDQSFNQYLGENFRAFSIFESPNYLAMFIVPATLISAGLLSKFKDQKSKFWKKAYYLSSILPLLALILSESRAGLIALVGSLGIMGVALLYRKLERAGQKTLLLISAAILSSVFCILVFKFALRPDTDAIRFQIYQFSWTMVKENWLTGIGAGNFHQVLSSMPIEGTHIADNLSYAIHPHNLYLALWLSFGLLGLCSFLSLSFWSIYLLLKKSSPASLFILAALSAILIHGIFDTTYLKNDLSAIFWLIVTLALIANDQRRLRID